MTNLITRAMAKKAVMAVKAAKASIESKHDYIGFMRYIGARFNHRIANANRKFDVTFARKENNDFSDDIYQIWEVNPYSIYNNPDNKFMFSTDTDGITTVIVVDYIGNSKIYKFERGEI